MTQTMDLTEAGQILYMSSVDVSIGNGPGVNEREFIVSLHSVLGSRVHFILPRPRLPFDELPRSVCTFTVPHDRHHPVRYLVHTVSAIRHAERILRERTYDLIVFRLDLLPCAPLYLAHRSKTPYALKTVGQGLVNVLYERLPRFASPVGHVNRRMVRALVNGAIASDTVSLLQVEYLQRLLGLSPGRLDWIDNAVNTDRFFPSGKDAARDVLGLRDLDPILGYVGELPWERGGQAIVEALPTLQKSFPSIGAVIVGGDGPQLDALKSRCRDLGVSERCRVVGRVPFPDIPMYVNAFDVGVSISARADRKAASELKVRQYVSCGKPVVASPGGNDFLLEAALGSIVNAQDRASIEASLAGWVSLTENEQEAHAARAHAYACNHLSMEAAVRRRLDLWGCRLGNGKEPECPML